MHAHPTYNAVEEQTTILQHAVSHNRILECVTAGDLALGMNSTRNTIFRQITIRSNKKAQQTSASHLVPVDFLLGIEIEFEIEPL